MTKVAMIETGSQKVRGSNPLSSTNMYGRQNSYIFPLPACFQHWKCVFQTVQNSQSLVMSGYRSVLIAKLYY